MRGPARAALLSRVALFAAPFVVSALDAAAQPAPPGGPGRAPRPAASASAAPSDSVKPSDDVLPPAPTVADPMLAPLPAPARTVRTWEEALTLVRSRSTDLRTALDEVERAEGQSRVALAGALTQVSAGGSLTYNFLQGSYPVGQGVSVAYPTRTVLAGQIGLVQPVLSPRAWYAIGTAHRAEDVARMTLDERKRTLAIDVAGTLVAEMAAERVAELNRVGLRQALERLALARRREELGSGTHLDVLRAEQDADAARAAVVSGDETTRQNREALGIALGLAEPVGATPGMNIDGLVRDTGTGCKLVGTLDERADLRALRTQVDIAARGEKDVWYQFSPTVSFQSTLATSNDALAIPATTWNLQGVLSIPLWDGGARYGELRQARAVKDEAEQALTAQRRSAVIQIEQARRAVEVAQESLEVAVSAEEHARQVDHMTQVGFLKGQGTSLDLVVSAGALRQAQINRALRDFDLVRARIDALLSLADCHW